jgi:predicted Zn-dependent peptidase
MNRTEAPKTTNNHRVSFVKPTCIDASSNFYQIENNMDESMRLELIFDGGSKFQAKKLQSSFTADLLLSGTASMSSKEINDAIDLEGGYLQCEADRDTIIITIYCLASKFEKIWDVIEESLLNVDFPQSEFDTLLAMKRQQYQVNSEKVSNLARRAFSKTLFTEGSPYDAVSTLEDYDLLNRSDIVDFYESNILKGLHGVILVGTLPESMMERLMAFGSHLKGRHEVRHFEYASKVGVEKIEKKGAIQSAVRIGKTMVNRGHEDFVPMQVLNTILGGYFGSRLMANIREDKGYTYGIGSGIAPLPDSAYFFISTEVGSDVREDALKEIKKEVELLQNETLDPLELDLVKNYLIGQFLKGSDGPYAMMDRFKSIWHFGLDYDYYESYFDTIDKLNVDDIQKMAKKYLNWDEMSIVTVG